MRNIWGVEGRSGTELPKRDHFGVAIFAGRAHVSEYGLNCLKSQTNCIRKEVTSMSLKWTKILKNHIEKGRVWDKNISNVAQALN